MQPTKQVHADNQIYKHQSNRYYKLNSENGNPPQAMLNVPRLPAVFLAGSFRQLVPSEGMPSAKGICQRHGFATFGKRLVRLHFVLIYFDPFSQLRSVSNNIFVAVLLLVFLRCFKIVGRLFSIIECNSQIAFHILILKS
jgi:hypothetical protein